MSNPLHNIGARFDSIVELVTEAERRAVEVEDLELASELRDLVIDLSVVRGDAGQLEGQIDQRLADEADWHAEQQIENHIDRHGR